MSTEQGENPPAGPTASTPPPPSKDLTGAALAHRGNEITGLDIYKPTEREDSISPERVAELMAKISADQPAGGIDLEYGYVGTLHGNAEPHLIRYWTPAFTIPEAAADKTARHPTIVFIHGGSWRAGTYLDSLGAAKVKHYTDRGYAFASVDFSLVPRVTVEQQVNECANAVRHLAERADELGHHAQRFVLMGHSSGAHVAALLGTDPRYARRAGFWGGKIEGVVLLDGSNYNAPAELIDSPGPVADNMLAGLGGNVNTLRAMSPTLQCRHSPRPAFLLLHVQRQGDIRQALELAAARAARGGLAEVRVFEGQGFEGHVAMLLRLGDEDYPATQVLDKWLDDTAPVYRRKTVVYPEKAKEKEPEAKEQTPKEPESEEQEPI